MKRTPLLFITQRRPKPFSFSGFAMSFSRSEQQTAKLIYRDLCFLSLVGVPRPLKQNVLYVTSPVMPAVNRDLAYSMHQTKKFSDWRDLFARAAHCSLATQITKRKSLSGANPSVGTAQVAKKSMASSRPSFACQVVMTVSLLFGPANFCAPFSSSTGTSSTMS
jgi:hypothetical protein